MSRFVKPVPFGLPARAAAAASGSSPAKEYFERIGKYVPGEIIASYTALNALLVAFPEQIKYGAFIFCFILCWVLTPVYFKLISTPADRPSLKMQQIISLIAFPIWAYAIDGGKGIFGKEVFDIYYQAVGGALLIVFTLISGAFYPTV
ncbi:hypothetical protein MUY27_00285 [Mucilaginibacter sp. RS28]|uniref:Uncharacterized protein n=1 Tax=Mucilaginibacter straminoryzae TaxID=2932774 RepID=A0A9X1WYQ9_9SPHI|nr:hypothetical protein [Mucilaginibacter straminoryzae]MCJ8208122.1 hypothetical protein [Mucilaginibacter straminoryzae]